MIIAIVILSYFVMSYTIAVIIAGKDNCFDGLEWLSYFLVVLFPPLPFIIQAIQIARIKRLHKRKRRQDK